MTLIEMEGFLRGKCLPGDILVGETNSQYLLRKLNAATELHRQLTASEATVTNLTAQVQGLAAENAVLVKANKVALNILNDEETMVTSLWASSVQSVSVETPATDATLAEIRAQGVDAFAADLGNAYQQLRAGSPQAKALKGVVFRAAHFSEQLRKEQGK